MGIRGKAGRERRKSDEERDRVLSEIVRAVLAESENLKEEKERLLEERVTLGALEELTDLPPERIREISDRVKTAHRQDSAYPAAGRRLILARRVLIPVLLILARGLWR